MIFTPGLVAFKNPNRLAKFIHFAYIITFVILIAFVFLGAHGLLIFLILTVYPNSYPFMDHTSIDLFSLSKYNL